MTVVRVTTGHDEAGNAVFVADEDVQPVTLSLMPGFATTELWHTLKTPTMPDALGGSGIPSYFPEAGGTVVRVVTFPPDGTSFDDPAFDFEAAIEEAQEKLPALVDKLEPDNPGMHTTNSVDYGIVLDGELDLELDNGVTTTVRPGTVVIQRGTRHAWRNRSGQPALVAFVLVGAHPAGA